MKGITVKVTKGHLDAAIKAQRGANYWLIETCLVAQAVRAAFPRKRVQVLSDEAHVGKIVYSVDRKGQRLINRFDSITVGLEFDGTADARTKKRIAAFRKSLPQTIKLTEQVPETVNA
jgi:hypothetical protein